MEIKIGQPEAFTEPGKKDQQEDRLYPPLNQLTDKIKCFVLCDGMGGHEQGEVAAEIISTSLYNSLAATYPADGVLTKGWFNRSLNAAYDALDKMTYHTERRPGTTLTCSVLGANGILVAHIGDSRIYLVRPGKGIIYRSEDHSLVNQLIRAGELTEEEAVNFPRRNVITRAMQPGLEKRYAADLYMLTDVKPGDYIFMCCDGILEQLTDQHLVEIISADTSAPDKLTEIFNTCFGKTRDNFTCYLIPITGVEGEPVSVPIEEATEVSPERVNVYGQVASTATAVAGDTTQTIAAPPARTQHANPASANGVRVARPGAQGDFGGTRPTFQTFSAQRMARNKTGILVTAVSCLSVLVVALLVYFLWLQPTQSTDQVNKPSGAQPTPVTNTAGKPTVSNGTTVTPGNNGEGVDDQDQPLENQDLPLSAADIAKLKQAKDYYTTIGDGNKNYINNYLISRKREDLKGKSAKYLKGYLEQLGIDEEAIQNNPAILDCVYEMLSDAENAEKHYSRLLKLLTN